MMSDQGDMPTSNCYSLHLQVSLLSNRLRQGRLNEIFFEATLCRCYAALSILRGDNPPPTAIHKRTDRV